MRKIILYIAISLDGKIADKDGGVGWLDKIPNPDKSDYGYHEFYETIDTTIMGNKTYQQVLGFGIGNPYEGKKNYVITKDKSLKSNDDVEYVSENIVDFISNLKQNRGKDIWCVGGAEINSLLLNENLIDEIRIFLMPVILGEGIPLTGVLKNLVNLKLISSRSYSSGVMELSYETLSE